MPRADAASKRVVLAIGYLREGEDAASGWYFISLGVLLSGVPFAVVVGRGGSVGDALAWVLLLSPLSLLAAYKGVRALFTYNELRLDVASGQIEEAKIAMGTATLRSSSAQGLDRVRLREVIDKSGDWKHYELRLAGAAQQAVDLGSYDYRPDAMYLGLRVARAGGFSYEEQFERSAPLLLSAGEVGRLPAPDARASGRRPWWRRPSSFALIAANMVPLWGVLHSGWSLLEVLLLFWCEMLVIGAFALVRIAMARGDSVTSEGKQGRPGRILRGAMLAVPFVPAMSLVGSMVVYAFGAKDIMQHMSTPFSLHQLLREVLTRYELGMALLALAASHGIGFWLDYLRPRAWEDDLWSNAAAVPVRRILVLLLVLVGASLGVQELGGAPGLVALLIVLKVAVDLGAREGEIASPWRRKVREFMAARLR